MPGSICQVLTHSLNTLSFVVCDLVRLGARFPVSPRTGCREPVCGELPNWPECGGF
jgi:hypothetical protein